MKLKALLMSAVAVAALSGPAMAQEVTLRMQTNYDTEHPTGKLLATFIDDVQTMSDGGISIEMFYSSSVVATVETFGAAINGILDCDATGGAYQTGKNPAFQFIGDIMGGTIRHGNSIAGSITVAATMPRKSFIMRKACS